MLTGEAGNVTIAAKRDEICTCLESALLKLASYWPIRKDGLIYVTLLEAMEYIPEVQVPLPYMPPEINHTLADVVQIVDDSNSAIIATVAKVNMVLSKKKIKVSSGCGI